MVVIVEKCYRLIKQQICKTKLHKSVKQKLVNKQGIEPKL